MVTDSFHACVFSILFRKPFVVYCNIGRGLSRINSLLKIFTMEGRLVSSADEFIDKKEHFLSLIDEAILNIALDSWRRKSQKFISRAGL